MGKGDPGQEQFSRAVTVLRNQHIAAAVAPLITMRQEAISNDELSNRGGTDNATRDHLKALLIRADEIRRHYTHNPLNKDLKTLIEESRDVAVTITDAENPSGGDTAQNSASGLFPFPFALDGTDTDIPLNSALKFKSSNALLIVGAIDQAIVAWTRLNSADRSRFYTEMDSLRMFGQYQQIIGYLDDFCGDDKRVDIAGKLPSDEPLGPTDSPNIIGEAARPQ